jgi:hypothetical protein
MNSHKRKKLTGKGKKDTILPSFVSSNCYTTLSDYIVSRSDNGMSLPIDYGTLRTPYNSESIFKKPRKYNMTSEKLAEDSSRSTFKKPRNYNMTSKKLAEDPSK